jgi:hypothetical protein
MLLHALPMSSALPDHHCNSSTSLVVKPMRPSSLGVMPRFLSLSSSRDSSSSLSQSSSFPLLQFQAPAVLHLSITSMDSLHATGRCLETLHLLWRSPWSLFESSGRNCQSFLAVTLWTYWALCLWNLSPFLSHVASGGDHMPIQKVLLWPMFHGSGDEASQFSNSWSPKWSLLALASSSIFRRCDH